MDYTGIVRKMGLAVIQGVRHRGCQVVLGILMYLAFANAMPLVLHRWLYTFSILLKDSLILILPVTVGLFIAHTVSGFERRAPLFILVLILFEGVSNFASVWYAFIGAHLAANFLPPLQLTITSSNFSTVFSLPITMPAWWSTSNGMIFGLILGCVTAFTKQPMLTHVISIGKDAAQWVLTRIFSRLIPLFVLGFVARMYQTNILNEVIAHYGVFLLWLFLLLAIYIMTLFFIGSTTEAIQNVKKILPAGGLAFTSGSSLSTMPWTIERTAKTLQNPAFARAVIPATTNIQQIGDCIANSFLCFLIYKHFYGCSPDIFTWLNFSIVFVLARYATAAVIGGAVFIMLPVYETYLSFTPEMIALILAFNVILDPLITASNVMANGALCRIFERVWNRILSSFQTKNC